MKLQSIIGTILNKRKDMLDDRINKRLSQIKSYSKLSPTILRSKTHDRIRMREELEKSIQYEEEQSKHIMYKKRKDFGKVINKNFVPEISQKKREEMQNLINFANSPAREKIARIKYTRAKDSILNKSNLIFGDINSSLQVSKINSDNENQYSKTLAFTKREESGDEYSPSKAYIPSGELEIVKEKLKK